MNYQPVKILEPQSKVGFSITLFVRLVVLVPLFFVAVFMITNAIRSILLGMKSEYLSLLPGIIFFVATGYLLFNYFFLNPRKMKELQYLFYEDKLVIYNKKRQKELHSIPFVSFPEYSFHENLNNFGYIVIGAQLPLVARNKSVPWRWGVSMEDPEIMLENLPNVKQEYFFLKELIERHTTQTGE